jgi:hypothetical protein
MLNGRAFSHTHLTISALFEVKKDQTGKPKDLLGLSFGMLPMRIGNVALLGTFEDSCY